MGGTGSETVDAEVEVGSAATVGYEARTPDKPTPAPGAKLGRYLVIDEIGHGGMGVVLRGYDPRLQREVALKVLRHDRLSERARRRLVREAQAMAKLSHPNVVGVYDVELDADGHVVIAMEYVAGTTLRQWLRDAERTPAQILEVFVAAAEGLAAAHAVPLLHRDFKPDNVLVGDDGRPRVTDFGLARAPGDERSLDGAVALDASSSGSRSGTDSMSGISVQVTEVGMAMGTPAYMSPEQETTPDIDEAADQYAFCVTLWEALAGQRPFPAKTRDELRRAKRAGPPAFPRDVGVPARVGEAIRRGLSPDPRQRWPSLRELLRELQTPVPRRRRVALAAGAVGVIAIATTMTIVARREQAATCRGAEAALASVWDDGMRARVHAALLDTKVPYAEDAWTRVSTRLDEYADGWVQIHEDACEATTLRREQSTDVLDLRMGCLQQAKRKLAAATSVLSNADAEVAARAPAIVGDLPSLARCSDIDALRSTVPPPPEGAEALVAEIEDELARAHALLTAGRIRDAERVLEAIDELHAQADWAPVATKIELQRGFVLDAAARYEPAAAALQRALRTSLQFGQWREAAMSARALVQVHGASLADESSALAYAEVARGVLPRIDDAHERAELHNSLGAAYRTAGRFVKAEAEYRLALEVEAGRGEAGRLAAGPIRNNLGAALFSQGRYADAEAEHRLALQLETERLGASHPGVGKTHNNLATTAQALGRLDDAAEHLDRALEIQSSALGPEHHDTLGTRENIAILLRARGEPEKAEAAFRACLDGYVAALGETHPDTSKVRQNLAGILVERGKIEEATAQLRLALTHAQRELSAEHPMVLSMRYNLGTLLNKQGDAEGAEAVWAEALTNAPAALGPDHPHVAVLHLALGRSMYRRGRRAQARPHLVAAYENLRDSTTVPADDVAEAEFAVAQMLDDPDEARALAELARGRIGALNDELAAEIDRWLRQRGA